MPLTSVVPDDQWYIRNESGLYHDAGISAAVPNNTITTGSVSNKTIYVPAGRIARLHGIYFSADYPINVAGNIIKGSWGSNTINSTRSEIGFVAGANGVNGFIDFHGVKLFEGGGIQFSVAFSGGQTPAGVTVPRANYRIIPAWELYTYDENFGAAYTYLALGDSITEGHSMGLDTTGGLYLGEWNFTNRLRDLLRNDGIDIRVVNNGWGSSKSSSLVAAIKAGYFTQSVPDLITIGYGMNDGLNSSNVALFKANLTFAAQYFYKKNPNVCIVFIGPTATNDPGRFSLPLFRDAMKALATTEKPVATGEFKFYDASKAYAVGENNALYYNAQEVTDNLANPGSKFLVHPAGPGSTSIATNTRGDADNGIAAGAQAGVYGVVKQTQFYANANRTLIIL